jgi:hypothetical protein
MLSGVRSECQDGSERSLRAFHPVMPHRLTSWAKDGNRFPRRAWFSRWRRSSSTSDSGHGRGNAWMLASQSSGSASKYGAALTFTPATGSTPRPGYHPGERRDQRPEARGPQGFR